MSRSVPVVPADVCKAFDVDGCALVDMACGLVTSLDAGASAEESADERELRCAIFGALLGIATERDRVARTGVD